MTSAHDAVVEQHRIKIGATKMHVDYNPERDPAELAAALDKLHTTMTLFDSIDPLTKAEAKIARYEALIKEVRELGRSTVEAFLSESEEVRALRRKVFRLTDMATFEQVDDTIAYARSQGIIE